ncbi:CG3328, partial [Drosophila busckii]
SKLESPHTPPMNVLDAQLTGRVSAMAMPLSHLPESPPDSGSEPAYSPLGESHVVGVPLASREMIYTGLVNMQQQQQQHLPSELQFTAPAQVQGQHQQQQQQQQHQHHLQQHQFVAPTQDVRVKHEGLIMNASNLLCEQQLLPQQQQLQQELQYQHYDTGLYTSGSYQSLNAIGNCMLTSSLGLGDRVQVIGTSQLSLNRSSTPSTPVHSLSRKRKLSTQLDCPDFAPKHADAGLLMSPLRSSQHSLAQVHAQPPPPLELEPVKTPAHSTHCSASVSPALSGINSQADNSLDGQTNGSQTNAGSGSEAGDPALTQCIRFNPFQMENWHKLCDQSLQELNVIYYRVDADKGFNFSVSDDAYVCQKKNHFQVTCHARLQGDAKFVKTPSGLEKIKSFHLHFYGVKFEAPNQTIRVEQSQSDRSKKPFYPVPIDLQSHIVSKITVGRLHFSETTNNNMRKKGRPNPEQRFFQLIVGLHVHTASGHFPVVSHGSERIIVRASNPGQFESDVDLCWQRGMTHDSICHTGRVGINTDRPDESLVVHGNLKVSGHIVQPSDSRAKQEIAELDTSDQLRNMCKIRIVRYRYEPEFAVHSGLRRESDTREIVDTGVIAQEVREVIPDAVQEAGSVVLPNGNVIENFLLVNKDRILMENIGAVKELCKMTGSLETRIEHLERANNNLHSQQLRAKDLLEPRCLLPPSTASLRLPHTAQRSDGYEICSSRLLQILIFLLIIVMAACLAAVSTLYFVEHNKQQQHLEAHPHFRTESRASAVDELQFNLHNLFRNRTHLLLPSVYYASSTTRPPAWRAEEELPLSAPPEEEQQQELSAVMSNPLLQLPLPKLHSRITTTAPRTSNNNNKTLSSKTNKSKWPLPQEVLRQVSSNVGVAQKLRNKNLTHHNHNYNGSSSSAVAASSSEPPAGLHLSQDFENNSIDIDAQLREREQLQPPRKLDEHIVVVGTIASTVVESSPPVAGQAIRKLNAGDAAIYNVYKTVSPPTANLALTTNKVSTEQSRAVPSVSLDLPAPVTVRNSSGASKDNADALDLQNLSNTNESESVDNPITALFGFEYAGLRDSSVGRRSANQRSLEWIKHKSLRTPLFGHAPECTGAESTNDNCQSACYEELPAAPAAADNLDANVQQPHAEEQLQSAEQEQDVDMPVLQSQTHNNDSAHLAVPAAAPAPRVYHGKSSHNTAAKSKQYSTEVEQDAPVGKADTSTAVPLPLPLDCWSISSCVLAAQFNHSIDEAQFCPSTGSSLNLSYVVPVSRYLHAASLELHFSANKPLQWSICNDEQPSKSSAGAQLAEDEDEAAPSSWLKVLKQQGNNKLILALDMPTRGYFLREFMLRASTDLEQQKLCDDNAHVANPILQYNFSIVRDCD